MVVASGAGDGEAHKASSDDVDAVVDDVVDSVGEASADGEEAHCGEGAFIGGEFEFVGGELFEDELVIREIIVEGTDDVVAIGVGIGVFGVLGEYVAFGVSVSGDVEPVACPANAVLFVGEELVDEFGPCIGSVVGGELLDGFV